MKYIVLILFSLNALLLIAGNGHNTPVLSGVVIDQSTGEPLPGVAIKIEGRDEAVYTDFDGHFDVEVNHATYSRKIHFTAMSYKDKEIEVSPNEFQRMRQVEIKMSSDF